MFPAYQDTIRSCILHSPLNPKKEYAYSDLGFILLKFAVEHVTEKSLDQYCQEEFYRKLGMHHTDFLAHKRLNKNNLVPSCVDKLYRKTELKGYVHDPVAALLGGIAGHAGLFSTAEDLAKTPVSTRSISPTNPQSISFTSRLCARITFWSHPDRPQAFTFRTCKAATSFLFAHPA